ncbi:hypothetical protein BMF94_0298 [Rhodotorula taiwanensis]|uniref:Uncharacterized protein n=1 Tax=Rhodotorula taiwanensis TaxID=741276 RepID=A0A2S5BIW3_9BASI|nr:hypothetical protein BMF94_0298 [Rhodotorula taiwanensis]
MSGSASSYSSLLRRSKLASFHPQIDQVYTASSANRARANYGLKRPLPALSPAAGARSPFVRITSLDSPERRTAYRRATREQQYTKKWLEVDAGLASEALVDRSAFGIGFSGDGEFVQRKWDRLPVQSRFVAPGTPGAVQPIDKVGQHQQQRQQLPNFFALTEAGFERFLSDLGSRRDEFRAFVLAEANKLAEQTGTSNGLVNDADFDLYAHAQRNPLELMRLVERFLRRPASSSPSSRSPLPQVHPTLALQYATPTPLESALAAPVPGRLLGPAPDGHSRSGGFYGMRSRKPDVYASVLSQVAPVAPQSTAGLAQTNFFPDVEGHRSNVPGRASFRITPTISPVPYANQTAITRTQVRQGSHEFRPPTAEYEPALLALRSVHLNPTVVPSSASGASMHTPSPAARPGSPAYSGALPRDLAGAGSGSGLSAYGRSGSAGGARQAAASLSDLVSGYGLSSARSRKEASTRRGGRTPEEQAKWLERRERMLGEGAATASGPGGAAGRNQGGNKKRKQGAQGRGDNRRQLMAALDALLEK